MGQSRQDFGLGVARKCATARHKALRFSYTPVGDKGVGATNDPAEQLLNLCLWPALAMNRTYPASTDRTQRPNVPN